MLRTRSPAFRLALTIAPLWLLGCAIKLGYDWYAVSSAVFSSPHYSAALRNCGEEWMNFPGYGWHKVASSRKTQLKCEEEVRKRFDGYAAGDRRRVTAVAWPFMALAPAMLLLAALVPALGRMLTLYWRWLRCLDATES